MRPCSFPRHVVPGAARDNFVTKSRPLVTFHLRDGGTAFQRVGEKFPDGFARSQTSLDKENQTAIQSRFITGIRTLIQ